jgi:hypothetical protein
MLANIVVCSGFLVDISAFKAAIRGVFLVLAPADSPGLEKIDDRLGRCADTAEVIATDSMSGTTDSSHIVGLRRVGKGKIIC